MRIYEVTFDGRLKGDPKGESEWGANWERVKVAVEDGGALAAIDLAELKVNHGEDYETRPAEVEVLADAE